MSTSDTIASVEISPSGKSVGLEITNGTLSVSS